MNQEKVNQSDIMNDTTLEQLQARIQQVRKLLEADDWNYASTIMNFIRIRALELFQGDELALGMAEFYFMLGNVLVCKIENSQDLFGTTVQKAEDIVKASSSEKSNSEQDSEEDLDEDIEINDEGGVASPKQKQVVPVIEGQVETVVENSEVVEDTKKQPKNKGKEKLDGDFQLAWENLEIAQIIYEKELKRLREVEEMNQFSDKTQLNSIIKRLAKVYFRRAELEQWRDNFEDSLKDHLVCLELRLQIDDHEKSRDIAESYYSIGNVHLYNYEPGCEMLAMNNYKKALQILENYLSDKLKLPKKDVSNIDIETPTTFHLNQSFLDTPETEELKLVVKLIYNKIEDLKLSLKESQSVEYKMLLQQFQDQKEQQTQKFNKATMPQTQVTNLGSFGNAQKRAQNNQQQHQLVMGEDKENNADTNNVQQKPQVNQEQLEQNEFEEGPGQKIKDD